MNLGTALIKQVVEQLRRRPAALQRFVTLSPIPGFRALARRPTLHRRRSPRRTSASCCPAEPERVLARLADDDWGADEAIKPALLALCARYLTTTRDGRALDPGRELPPRERRVDRADRLARRPEPDADATARPA